jgi:flagellar basal-body rod protein FlgG
MIRSIYTGTTGMNAQQLNIDVISNNLANVSTPGFKKSTNEFQDLLYEALVVPGSPTSTDTQSPTGVVVGVGVRPASVTKVYSQGELQQTENELDVAIEGNGFFQIEMPNGETAYTRAGAFRLDSAGVLSNANGYPVLPAITVPDGSRNIVISDTGIVSAILSGDTDSTELGTLELAIFTNPAGLLPGGNNLLFETTSSGTATVDVPSADGFGVLLQRFLEGSNVNIVQELANLITAQRAYEINSKTIQTSDEMMQTTNNLV